MNEIIEKYKLLNKTMTTSEFINKNLNGMSQYRLSKLSGISTPLINVIIKGKSDPSISKFKQIVKALVVSDEEILKFIKQ